MKISSFLFTASLIAVFFLLQGSQTGKRVQKVGSFYSAETKKVIDGKCYGCHSAAGQSQNAKNALMWDSLPGLQKSKLVASLDDIIRVLKEDEMPPAGAVRRNPEMKLQPGEKRILQLWAESRADSLLK